MGVKLIRRKRDKTRYYQIDFLVPRGDGTYKRVREHGGATRELAVAKLSRRKAEVRDGTYINPKEAQKNGITVAEFVDGYTDSEGKKRGFMRDHAALTRSDHYYVHLATFTAMFGARPIHEITRADLDHYRAEMDRSVRKLSPSTIRKRLIAVGTLFKKAVRWGVLKGSPAVDLDMPNEPKHRIRYLSEEEWRTLKTRESNNHRMLILRMALAQGLRLKEATNLTWDAIDFKAGLLYVSEDSKTGEPDPVPLTAEARAVLKEQPRRLGCSYVFTDEDGKPYDTDTKRNTLTQWTRTAMKRAGIEGASFHTLRHTCASWQVQRDVPLRKTQEFMRHKSMEMTLRYAHLQPQHLGASVAAMDEAMNEIDTPMDTSSADRTEKTA